MLKDIGYSKYTFNSTQEYRDSLKTMNKISALIIAPSRELVEQIHNQFVELIQVEIKNVTVKEKVKTKKVKKNKNKKDSNNESENEIKNDDIESTPTISEFKPLFKICKIVGGIYEDKD